MGSRVTSGREAGRAGWLEPPALSVLVVASVVAVALMASAGVRPALADAPPAESVFPLAIGATEVEVGINYRTWSVGQEAGESDIDQLAIPVYVRSRLGESLDFSYLFTAASSSLDFGGSGEGDLSGVTDGKLGLTYLLPDRRFSLGLGLRVPTGESELDPTEQAVAAILNDRILGFRVKRYGEGFDLEARAGYATVIAPGMTMAGAISYVLKGDFPILDPVTGGESTYEPGNELSFVGRLRARAMARDWSGDLRVASYSRDQRDGADEIQEGTEVEISGSVVGEHLAGIVVLDAGFLLKGTTEVLSAAGLSPVRDVGGNILRFGGGFYGKLDARSELGGRAGLNLYGEAENGTGDGLVFEIGPRYRRELGGGLAAGLAYTLSVGDAEDGTIDLSGHDVTATFGYGWGRR
jgi:hypothetical protein